MSTHYPLHVQTTHSETIVQRLWREVAKFGIVGAISFVVDMGLFNLLVTGPMDSKITTAKIVSGAVATAVAWIGNRFWTFRHRRNRPVHHEVALFFAVNGIALGISALWIAFTHYVLHLDGAFWLNVNAFIGIGLGTLFRFWTYRRFVFASELDEEGRDPSDLVVVEHRSASVD
ncbi:putative flippase GtrA [Calidifontibacter indicus]|uniref:Putative flippase GtrA n=1 Tax=Calidifontibacter indicus TaxID=419650 RepID=A0A3D9UWT2_9MICO|nr:putative flippase GtrA [Calidifontibacter indicus]